MQIWQNVSETCQAIFERARKLLQGWKEANMCKARLGEANSSLLCVLSAPYQPTGAAVQRWEKANSSLLRVLSAPYQLAAAPKPNTTIMLGYT